MTEPAGNSHIAAAETLTLPPGKALGVLAMFIVVIAGYVVIGSLLGLKSPFGGTLLLFYWAAVNHLVPRELPAATFGALGGVFNASLFVILVPGIGQGPAALCALLLLIIALYFLLRGWLPLFFNNAYMLLITVAAIPEVIATGRFVDIALSVLFGAAYFGGLVMVPSLVGRLRARRKPNLS